MKIVVQRCKKASVTVNDKILTLFTCDDDTTYRILVHAKLVPLN